MSISTSCCSYVGLLVVQLLNKLSCYDTILVTNSRVILFDLLLYKASLVYVARDQLIGYLHSGSSRVRLARLRLCVITKLNYHYGVVTKSGKRKIGIEAVEELFENIPGSFKFGQYKTIPD